MKRKLFFTLLLTIIASITFGQDLMITGVFDGSLTGGTPKGVELFVLEDIADLSIYGLGSANNGGGTDGEEFEFPSVAATKGSFIYVATEEPNFISFFGFAPNYTDSAMGINGDDAVELFMNDVVVDVFGDINVDGTGESWEYLDGWAYRKSGNLLNTTFTNANWTFSGINIFDGVTTNATASNSFPIGTFSVQASTTPEITATGNATNFEYYMGFGPSEEQEITISGENLTADITVTASANFEVSLTSGSNFSRSLTIMQTNGVASATIYVRLMAGLSANTYTGSVVASSDGATDFTAEFTGIVTPADPQFSLAESLSTFDYFASENASSEEQTFIVEGLFLTNNLTLAVPTNFELSLTTEAGFANELSIAPTSGTIAETTIYVRLKAGLAVGNYTEDITISSIGLQNKTIALIGNVFGDLTNSIVITGVFDGSLSGGTPKGVELYVTQDIEDLSFFGISSVTNGQGSTVGNIEFSFPQITAKQGDFIYISTTDTDFNTFFGKAPDYVSNVVNINGDDAIELYENGQIIDVFGDVNIDGSGKPWEYLDGWAYRKPNTGPEGTTFTLENWTFSGVDGLEGGTDNATATSPFPMATYLNSTASLSSNSILGFKTYPNPITNKELTIATSNSNTKEIVIYNLLGKKVLATKFSGVRVTIDVSEVDNGLYILKVTEEGKTATQKLVIQ